MSKKKNLTAFQERLIRVIDGCAEISETIQKSLPFDFPCVNDDCCAIVGEDRVESTAWKSTDGKSYKVFCISCGFLETFSKEQFYQKKSDLDHEKALANMAKERVRRTKLKKAIGE